METRITDWLDRFDLSDDADKRIDDYSKGMRQKVGLIQALLHDPDVVFLDEPTSGLDPRAARTVLDVIADLTDDGHTVFLSTHILSVVEELADVVGVLYEGDLVTEGSPTELTARMEAEEGNDPRRRVPLGHRRTRTGSFRIGSQKHRRRCGPTRRTSR